MHPIWLIPIAAVAVPLSLRIVGWVGDWLDSMCGDRLREWLERHPPR